MVKRVTVMIDDDIHDKLRKIQAKKIMQTRNAISFSNIVNEVLTKQLK